jgi:F-type H+-transporting ATPase subunit b
MTAVTLLLAAEEELELLPATDELLWGSVFFAILFIALAKFVFPKAKKGMAARAAKIHGQIEDADRVKREADDVLATYRTQLADARTEVSRIIDEGRKTADLLRAELTAKAEQEANAIVERARGEVAGERDRAVAELRATVGSISLDIAAKVIGKELSTGDAHKELVDRAISQLSQTSRNN